MGPGSQWFLEIEAGESAGIGRQVLETTIGSSRPVEARNLGSFDFPVSNSGSASKSKVNGGG